MSHYVNWGPICCKRCSSRAQFRKSKLGSGRTLFSGLHEGEREQHKLKEGIRKQTKKLKSGHTIEPKPQYQPKKSPKTPPTLFDSYTDLPQQYLLVGEKFKHLFSLCIIFSFWFCPRDSVYSLCIPFFFFFFFFFYGWLNYIPVYLGVFFFTLCVVVVGSL